MLAIILYVIHFDKKKTVKLLISIFLSIYFGFKLNILINFKECPECYGDELCDSFQNQDIQLSRISQLLLLLNPRLTKSVFHGFLNGTEIVVKRKAARTQMTLTENFTFENVIDNFELKAELPQDVILCPGFRDLGFLLNSSDRYDNQKLWFNLKTSIEPLLLKSHGDWPVSSYLGSCGDVIVQEYKGKPLKDILSADFKTRAQAAWKLLKMAQTFTLQHPELAFYFTDFSIHNLVIDSNGDIYLIDLDNIIIFNKTYAEGNSLMKGDIHTSEIFNEKDYSFSPLDICSYHLSDHNYFSVCKFLLSHPKEGLLRNVPMQYSELLYFLNECTIPKTMSNRISAGQKLQNFLVKFIED